MNTIEGEGGAPTGAEGFSIQISLLSLLGGLWQRRFSLLIFPLVGGVIVAVYSYLTPEIFTSTIRLMPPDQQSLNSTSVLSPLSGTPTFSGGLGGGLMSQRTAGSTAIGILSSHTVEEALVHRFHLREVYRCKFDVDAMKKLEKNTYIEEDKKTGLIAISVSDKERTRARDIASAYVEELNAVLIQVSTSSAHRERLFLEDRIKEAKSSLDSAETALSTFSSKNATVDVQGQGLSIINAAARAQGELTAAQTELQSLRLHYTEDSFPVKEQKVRVNQLQEQLRKMGGIGESPNAAELQTDQIYPSLRKLPLLGATYFQLYHRVAIEQTIYELLTKQYELARIQEAKEIPQMKVLDPAELAEKRSFPKRVPLIAFGTLLAGFVGLIFYIGRGLWEQMDATAPCRIFVARLWQIVNTETV